MSTNPSIPHSVINLKLPSNRVTQHSVQQQIQHWLHSHFSPLHFLKFHRKCSFLLPSDLDFGFLHFDVSLAETSRRWTENEESNGGEQYERTRILPNSEQNYPTQQMTAHSNQQMVASNIINVKLDPAPVLDVKEWTLRVE